MTRNLRGTKLPKDMLKSETPARIFYVNLHLQKDAYCIIPTNLEWLHSHSGVQMKALFPTISSTCHKELPREDSCPAHTCNLAVPPLWSAAELRTKESIWQDSDIAERGV